MRRLSQVAAILAVMGASCASPIAQPTTTADDPPEALDTACGVVKEFNTVLDTAEALSQPLEDVGYRFTEVATGAQKKIYRDWREEHLAQIENLLDDATAVVVDARGLAETRNPYGTTILRYAVDRRDVYAYIVDNVSGGLVRNDEYSAVDAEYDIVAKRCEEASNGEDAD